MWRHFVNEFLRSQAAGRARDVVWQAARASTEAAMAPEGASESAGPCDVGVVFALGIEAGGLLDTLAGPVKTKGHGFVAYEGGIEGRRVVVVEAGAGREQAARATESLIVGHQPAWVISAGFAGALVPELARNELFVPSSLALPSGERLAIEIKMPPAEHLHFGRLLTSDALVRTREEKQALAEAHGAQAVDMEAFAVAEACRQAKTRCFCVRVISDALDDELPPEIENLLHQQSLSGKVGAVAGSIFRRPSSIKDMWNLKEQALVASDRLAKFLGEIIAQLPRRELPPEGQPAAPSAAAITDRSALKCELPEGAGNGA